VKNTGKEFSKEQEGGGRGEKVIEPPPEVELSQGPPRLDLDKQVK